MSKEHVEGVEFIGEVGADLIHNVEEFTDCLFQDIDFSSLDLRGHQFEESRFQSCNLSNAIVEGVGFKDVSFLDCKLLGVRFDTVNPFLLKMEFEKCNLSMSVFAGMKMIKTGFVDCDLSSTDFVEANLEGAIFTHSNLAGAIFESSNLKHCDFREAVNYQINPELNSISKAKFSRDSIDGLLANFGIILE
jgi:uncharacterized protein YjbI with pentapeptide repeats